MNLQCLTGEFEQLIKCKNICWKIIKHKWDFDDIGKRWDIQTHCSQFQVLRILHTACLREGQWEYWERHCHFGLLWRHCCVGSGYLRICHCRHNMSGACAGSPPGALRGRNLWTVELLLGKSWREGVPVRGIRAGEGPKYAAGVDYEPPAMGVWGVVIKGGDSLVRGAHTMLRHALPSQLQGTCYTYSGCFGITWCPENRQEIWLG